MSVRDYLQSQYLAGLDTHPQRERIKNVLTTGLVPFERRRAAALEQPRQSLKLHIGCGDTYLRDWVNIDMARPGRRLDLRWDLRRGLPFSDGSVSAIFSEHFFEHLDLHSAMQMMLECRRVLGAGGICRIGVPDFGRYMNAYDGSDAIIDEVRGYTPTKAIAINEIFYFYGHRSMYDSETLAVMLREAGFSSVKHLSFGESALAPCPDSINRRPETLYIEALA